VVVGPERQTIRGVADRIAGLGPVRYRPRFGANASGKNVTGTTFAMTRRSPAESFRVHQAGRSRSSGLDDADVSITARTGHVRVAAGKASKPRVVPLSAQTRSAITAWREHRGRRPAACGTRRCL
jgi:hypothetical protein